MHISSDFVYFPHISEPFWIILDKFHSIFLILCDGKAKHRRIAGDGQWWADCPPLPISGPKCPFIPFFFQPVVFCLIWARFLAEECIFQVILSIFTHFRTVLDNFGQISFNIIKGQLGPLMGSTGYSPMLFFRLEDSGLSWAPFRLVWASTRRISNKT